MTCQSMYYVFDVHLKNETYVMHQLHTQLCEKAVPMMFCQVNEHRGQLSFIKTMTVSHCKDDVS